MLWPRASELCAQGVIIATGISYRRLSSKRLEELVGAGVFYGSVSSEARSLSGFSVYIVGSGNSAGQAAMHLAKFAKEVTLVSRGAGSERRDVGLPRHDAGADART